MGIARIVEPEAATLATEAIEVATNATQFVAPLSAESWQTSSALDSVNSITESQLHKWLHRFISCFPTPASCKTIELVQ